MVVGCAEQDCPSVPDFADELRNYIHNVSSRYRYEIVEDFFGEVRTLAIRLLGSVLHT